MTLTADTAAGLALGLGLAAACGFRVFVPLLIVSLGARLGYVPLAAGWDWVASVPATVAFGSATLIEVLGYYIPWLDHVLDLIATPAAVAAGIVTSACVVADLPPLVKWAAVIIGGGGLAAVVQGCTVALRAASGATTGGLGNPVVATGELAGSSLTALAAIVAPLIALAAILLFLVVLVLILRRVATRRRPVRR
ncbi:MAG: DUF4126 domain-containing protein [Bacteroidales bacterium]